MTDKLIRDGKVAVLVSPGYGAGWSTWNHPAKELAMDRELAEAVLSDNPQARFEVAERKWPDAYTGGLDDVVVEWVTQGDRFEIHEYVGNESLHILGPDDGMVA